MPKPPLIARIFAEKYQTSLQNPAQTLEGHINHENGIVNDYRGRAIFEFFQNAIDRAKSRIWIHLDKSKGTLTIANDGQPFSVQKIGKQPYSDFSAVCSINTSSKNQNESIGNKGVGFKSCWEYARQVSVISEHHADDGNERWGFRLHNPLSKSRLEQFACKDPEILEWLQRSDIADVIKRKEKIPSFYFPERITDIPPKPLGMEEAITIITFEQLVEGAVQILQDKIQEFASHQIFFVQQLETLSKKEVTLELKVDETVIAALDTRPNSNDWHIVSRSFEGEALEKLQTESANLNYKVDAPKIAIAFPLKEDLLQPIADTDTQFPEGQPAKHGGSLFYCYLPTQETIGFNVLIHGDFLLDVSRKQIDFENNPYNALLLDQVADLLVETLCSNDTIHNLPFFARFISLNGTNPHLANRVTNLLLPKLQDLLRKVYHKDRKWGLKAYEEIFNTIQSWRVQRGYYERNEAIKSKTRERLQQFCGEGIFIVPLQPAEDNLVLTYLPEGKEQPGQFAASLFFKEEKGDGYDITLLSEIPNLAISSFEPLHDDLFKEFKIVREFNRIDLSRALAQAAERTAHLRSNILKFCCQLVATDFQPSRQDFFKEDSGSRHMGRIYLPTKGHGWKPAIQCYTSIPAALSQTFDHDRFFELDLDQFIHHHQSPNPTQLLAAFGVWQNELPIDSQRDRLPWGDTPPRLLDRNIVMEAVRNSISYLVGDPGMAKVLSLLRSQPWFPHEGGKALVGSDQHGDAYSSPQDVFLFTTQDRKMPCMFQARDSEPWRGLHEALGIRKIDDTQDAGKIIRHLHRLAELVPHSHDLHPDMYKALTRRLARLWRDGAAPQLVFASIPRLARSTDGHFRYAGAAEELTFTPAEQRRFKQYFRTETYIHLDDETSKEFVKGIPGVKILDPHFVIEYEGQDGLDAVPIPDAETKAKLGTDHLPTLVCLAANALGAAFQQDAAILRWQNLDIVNAYNVRLRVNGVVVESTHATNADVVYVPLTDAERSGNEAKVGTIAHDLQRPIDPGQVKKFAPAAADLVFRNLTLIPLFSEYLTRYELDQLQADKPQTAVTELLEGNGITAADLQAATEYLAQGLLSQADLELLVERLRECTGNSEISKDNWTALKCYRNYHGTLASLRQEAGLNDRLEWVLQQLDPYPANLAALRIAMPELQLRDAFVHQEDATPPAALELDHVRIKCESLLHHFDFGLDQVHARLGIPSVIPREQLESFRIRRDHQLPKVNLVPSQPYSLQPITPKESQGRPHVSRVNVDKIARDQAAGHTRGIGTERLLCWEVANHFLSEHPERVQALLQALHRIVTDEEIGGDGKLEYLDLLQKMQGKTPPAEKLAAILQASEAIGDGLGYDIFYPEIILDTNSKGTLRILKVEVKSSKAEGNKRVFLSENERLRILHFAQRPQENWRLWLNSPEGDITAIIIDAVRRHQESLDLQDGVPLYSEEWFFVVG